jgi:hypothetical protein
MTPWLYLRAFFLPGPCPAQPHPGGLEIEEGEGLQRGEKKEELPHQAEGENPARTLIRAGEPLISTGSSSHHRFSVSSRAEQEITTDVLSAPILPARSQV